MGDVLGVAEGVFGGEETTPRVSEDGDRLIAEVSPDGVQVFGLGLDADIFRNHSRRRPSPTPLVVVDEVGPVCETVEFR